MSAREWMRTPSHDGLWWRAVKGDHTPRLVEAVDHAMYYVELTDANARHALPLADDPRVLWRDALSVLASSQSKSRPTMGGLWFMDGFGRVRVVEVNRDSRWPSSPNAFRVVDPFGLPDAVFHINDFPARWWPVITPSQPRF